MMRLVQLFVCVMVACFVSATAMAQQAAAPVAPAARLTAEVFSRAPFPAALYQAAKAADLVFEKTKAARTAAVATALRTREALRVALASKETSYIGLLTAYGAHMNADLEAGGIVDRDLQAADYKVFVAYLDWVETGRAGGVSLASLDVYDKWQAAALADYGSTKYVPSPELDQALKRLDELNAAEAKERERRREEDRKMLEDFQRLIREVTKDPTGK